MVLRVSGNCLDCDEVLSSVAGEGDAKICPAVCSADSVSCRAERAAKAALIAFTMEKAKREGGMAAPER